MARTLIAMHQDYELVKDLLSQFVEDPSAIANGRYKEFLKKQGYDVSPTQVLNYKIWNLYAERFELLVQYQNGELTTADFNTKFGKDNLTQFQSDVAAAKKTRQERQLGDINRNMKTIWLQGRGGIGKTSFAKAKAAADYGEGNICVVQNEATRNPFDSYDCQKVIIYDDYHFGVGELQDGVWFKNNFDPNTATVAAARYCDKTMAHVELSIITETYAPGEKVADNNWWTEADADQFWRRLDFCWYELTENGLFKHSIPRYQNIRMPKKNEIETTQIMTAEEVLKYIPFQEEAWRRLRFAKQNPIYLLY